MIVSDFLDPRRYRSISAAVGTDSGPLSGFVRMHRNERKWGVGRRAIIHGMIDFLCQDD
jgi:hypothetical protein